MRARLKNKHSGYACLLHSCRERSRVCIAGDPQAGIQSCLSVLGSRLRDRGCCHGNHSASIWNQEEKGTGGIAVSGDQRWDQSQRGMVMRAEDTGVWALVREE